MESKELSRALNLLSEMLRNNKRINERLDAMTDDLKRVTKKMRFDAWAPPAETPLDLESWDRIEDGESGLVAIRSSVSPTCLNDILQREIWNDEEEEEELWDLWSPSP